ncbi:MAG: glycosyltransferase [Planctomycetes bacterium]|nr:glycosyltransferase [Planctomycetota bacterium]
MRLLLWIPGHSILRWLPFAAELARSVHIRVLIPSYADSIPFEELGLDCAKVPTLGLSRLVGHAALDIPSPTALTKQMRCFHPDHVHAIAEPSYLATFFLSRASEGIATTSCRQAQNIFQTWPPPLNLTEGLALNKLSHIFALSREAKAILHRKGRKTGISILHNGFDSERFPFTERTKSTSPKLNFLFIGKLIERKGVDLLLRALGRLRDQNWTLKIVGDGDQKFHLSALAVEEKIANRVTFAPPVPNSQLKGHFESSDVLVLPSRTSSGKDWGIGKWVPLSCLRVAWKEQFGMVIPEAQACGIPCIGSTCGAIPEIIGDAGWVFEENNLNELHAVLKNLLSKGGIPPEMQGRAKKQSEQFTWEKVAADFLAEMPLNLNPPHEPTDSDKATKGERSTN